ncbi:O-methyltransferase [Corynebacterium sp. CNCTC7651]|uniref:O-methyltransferase n=1 Tax=Corynebacterium sp. CNCTC7651 TaxID=2815361 RepID=UPI001F35092C|nr:O-methyltransferase [Corynebacterium sp. CNCTC7651]UIZ92905.1 O-methyltransferase [Corynebacterium sp. CNCTC7651]
MTETAFSQMTAYINERNGSQAQFTEEFREGLSHAHVEAEENGVRAPSAIVGTLLSTLAAAHPASAGQGAVAVTPAAGVVGLHILRGLPEKATLTCIEPEAALQAEAKAAFKLGGYAPSRARFLTARPLDVMGRLANGAYQLIYADVAPLELPALIDVAWPLLSPGGTLVIADSLLDGTVADPSRRDRETEAAREADVRIDALAVDTGAVVTRLPLDGGLTLITKK